MSRLVVHDGCYVRGEDSNIIYIKFFNYNIVVYFL